jgi:uroporphyrinogen-III synthase
LLPRAAEARAVLPDGLRAAGAEVDDVPVYRTIPGVPAPQVLARVQAGEIDIVTLTSSSTARNLAALLNGRLAPLQRALVACISPLTAEAARSAGFRVDVVASEHTIPGLIAAVVAALEGSPA